MAVQKPRIAVTLTDETREIMQRLAELEGTPVAKVVASIVESFAPTAAQLVEAMHTYKCASKPNQARMQAYVDQVEDELQGKASAAQEALTAALEQAKEAAK